MGPRADAVAPLATRRTAPAPPCSRRAAPSARSRITAWPGVVMSTIATCCSCPRHWPSTSVARLSCAVAPSRSTRNSVCERSKKSATVPSPSRRISETSPDSATSERTSMARVTHEVLGVRRLCLRAAQDREVARMRRLDRAAQFTLGKEHIEPVVALDQRDRVVLTSARDRREHRALGRALPPLSKGRGGFGPIGERGSSCARAASARPAWLSPVTIPRHEKCA